ncbi:MAG: 4Fe-4S dicluster domain-containing protein, partial [Dehalococcoidia bacterium]
MGLSRVEKYLKPCMLCGACYGRGPEVPHNWRELNPHPAPERRCPSLDFFKFRTYGAMDRISLATIMRWEEYPVTDELKKVFYTCMMCGACREVCGIYDPVEIIRAAREEIIERAGPLTAHRKLLEGFAALGNPWRRPNKERNRWAHPSAEGLGLKEIARDSGDTLFFAGCTASLRPELRHMAQKAASLILQAGVEMAILGQDERCCGYVPRTLGDRAQFERLARENI